MRTTILAILLLFYASLAAQQPREDLPPQLDAYINRVLEKFNVPGMSVGIVKNGRLLLAKGYGVKELGRPEKVTEKTLFSIASNTKAFTATALAILVEEGKLAWSDPVIDHLPWFRMSDPYVTMQLTVRDILVHHSGLPAYGGDLLIFPPSTYSRKEIVEKLKDIPLRYPFRSQYAYDNILYLVAGELIEKVSGMPWEDFVQARILNKVGMTGTLPRFSLIDRQPDVSASHVLLNGKPVVAHRYSKQAIGDAGNPAGGILSNAADMCNWLITQLDSGRSPVGQTVFRPSSTAELWKIVCPMPIPRQPTALKAAQVDFYGYALGLRAYNYGAYKVIGHGGKLDGFVSQIAMVPALGLGVVVLTNQESTGAYWSVIYRILDHYMYNPPTDWTSAYRAQLDSSLARTARERKALPPAAASQKTPPLPLENYAGRYHDKSYGELEIRLNNGTLEMAFLQSPELKANLQYYQFNSFLAKFGNPTLRADSWVSFDLQPDGKIAAIRLQIIDPGSDLSFDNLLFKPLPPAVKQHSP